MDNLYKKVEEFFGKKYILGHDFRHAKAVAKFAKIIAKSEGYSELEAQAAGLLHDVGRTLQDDQGHGPVGVGIAKEFLDSFTNFSQDEKNRILHAIEVHSQKETNGKLNNILQDADKIDGMGVMGIIRTVAHNHKLIAYDLKDLRLDDLDNFPKTLYQQIMYQARWFNMLYTKKGKELARKKIEFMQKFLEEFDQEIEESEA